MQLCFPLKCSFNVKMFFFVSYSPIFLNNFSVYLSFYSKTISLFSVFTCFLSQYRTMHRSFQQKQKGPGHQTRGPPAAAHRFSQWQLNYIFMIARIRRSCVTHQHGIQRKHPAPICWSGACPRGVFPLRQSSCKYVFMCIRSKTRAYPQAHEVEHCRNL